MHIMNNFNKLDKDLVPMPQQDMADGKELTAIQKIAEQTHGIVTLPNLITIAGIGLVALGCNQFKHGHRARGIGLVALGAACDLVDGALARRMRVANYPAGRWGDIAADGAKAALIAKTACETKMIKKSELAVIYGPKMAGWALNGVAKFVLRHEPKTTGEGKIAEASRWVAMAGIIGGNVAKEQGKSSLAKKVKFIGALAATVSGILGVKSVASYVKQTEDNNKNLVSRDASTDH